MKVNVFNIDFDRAYNKNELYIQFKFISTIYHDIVIKIYDPYFKGNLGIEPYEMRCTPGESYWAEFSISDYTPWGTCTGPTIGFKAGFTIEFYSKTTGDRFIQEFQHNGKNYQYKKLSEQTPLSDRRIYMIGNSHIWSTFGVEEENINSVNQFCLSKITFYGLGLYNFFNGRYLDFISILPIVDNDVILFYWGTRDLRYSIFKQSKKHDISIDEALYNVMYLYYYSLKKISEAYPKNKIIITSVNSALRKEHIAIQHGENDEVFFNTTDEERLIVTRKFNEFMSRRVNEISNVTFFQWDEEYVDNDGYIKSELLFENDIHINTSKPALDALSKFLYHWGI